MRHVLCGLLMISFLAGSADAARLSLRGVNVDDPTAITLEVSQTAILELVLELQDGEEVGSANIFLDTVRTAPAGDVDGEAFEVLSVLRAGDPDFIWTNKRSFIVSPMDGLEFEDLSPGEGISLDDSGYFLVAALAEGDLLGGGTGTSHVLDRIVIHGTSPGTTEVSFETLPRQPSLFDASVVVYALAGAGDAEGAAGTLYLGVGDARDGGEGPLTVIVVEGTEPNGNGNSGTNTGPPAGGKGFCAWGMMGTMLFGLGALTLAKLGLRRRWSLVR